MNALERPPKYLGKAGRGLWNRIIERYILRDDELLILESACRQLDDLERLEAELRTAPTMVIGSAGQIRPHPLFSECRQGHQSLSRLLAQLGLGDAEAGGVSKSSAGHRLAKIRWQGKHAVGER
jgi:phage terminase small subunit